MANEQLSAAQRAALAQQAAAEARAAAARHALARRAEQDARRREVPTRRPPAITPKAGVAYRAGTTTTADASRGPLPATRPAPMTRRPADTPPAAVRSPVEDPAPRTATAVPPSRTPRRIPPSPTIARPVRPAPPDPIIAPPSTPAVAEEADVVTADPDLVVAPAPEPAAPSPSPVEEVREPQPPLVLPDAPRRAAVDAPALAEGQRLGSVSGLPTTIPPLPAPPVAVIRTTDALTGPADGLVLPAPPRAADGAPDHGAPDTSEPAEDAPDTPVPADASPPSGLATGDIDVSASLPPAAEQLQPADRPVVDEVPESDRPWAPAHRGGTGDAGSSDALAEAPAITPEDGPTADPPSADDPTADAPAAADAGATTAPAAADGPPPPEGERPWVRAYPPGVPETYRYPLVPVTRFLDDAAQDFPDVTAVTFLGTEITYRQLSEQVDRLAAAIAELGLRQGERIGVVLPWSPQLVLVLHAAWRSGLDPVVLDPETGAEELAAGIQAAAPDLLVVLDTLYDAVSAHRTQLGSVRHVIASSLLDCLPVLRARVQAVRLKVPGVQIPAADGVLAFRDVLDGAAPTATQADLAVDAVPALTVVDAEQQVRSLTHANVLAGAFQARLWIPDVQAGREGVALAGSPADPFAIGAGLGLAMLAAGTLVLPDPRQGGLARVIDDRRPTILVAPIDAVRKVLAPASKRRDLSSVRVTLAGGLDTDPAVRSAMEQRTGGRLRMALGASGLAGMALAQPIYADPRHGTAGLPVTDTDIRILDPDAAGTGLLQVDGPQVAGSGWASLDLFGFVDDKGQVTVVGPAGRVVRHSRGTSDPEAVGAALRRSDKVADALVRTEFTDDELRMVVQVVVTDPHVTDVQLEDVLRRAAPAQAPPHHWQLSLAVAEEPQPAPPAVVSVGGEEPPVAAEQPDTAPGPVPGPDVPGGEVGGADATLELPPQPGPADPPDRG